jgi:hypothetical protein
MLLAYFGPETVLPLTSLLAGVAGVFLMFGRGIGALARRAARVARPGSRRVAVPLGQSAGKRLRADGASPTPPEPGAPVGVPTQAHA